MPKIPPETLEKLALKPLPTLPLMEPSLSQPVKLCIARTVVSRAGWQGLRPRSQA